MVKFSVVNEIACDVDTFWSTFLSNEYNDELYLKRLGFPAYAVVKQTETDTSLFRMVTGQPKVNLPAAVTKLVGSNFGYTETGIFDKNTKVYTFKIALSVMTDKVLQDGSVQVAPIGDKRVRRTVDLRFEAKVFGLGSMLESNGERQLRESWGDSAIFMNEYVARAR